MTAEPEARLLRIEVVYALPERAHRVRLDLPPGATVGDALTAATRRPPLAGLDLEWGAMAVGVFGDRAELTRRLEAGDRVEIYRPLQIDPREARRQRAEQQRPTAPRGRRR